MVNRKPGDAERVIHSSLENDEVGLYVLLAVKHALKIEEKGMINSGKRTKLQPFWAVKLGLNKQATYATIYREIDSRCKKILAAD